MMEERVGSLDKEQLTRLAQYFDEKVIAASKYKRAARAPVSGPARRGVRLPGRSGEQAQTIALPGFSKTRNAPVPRATRLRSAS
jgi:hypothetical protein